MAHFNSKSSEWYNPKLDELIESHIPFHASKYIAYKRGALDFEQDIYYGTEDVRWYDSTFRESISITVYYGGVVDNFDIMKLKWEIFLSDENGIMEEVSLDHAKEIFSSWGILYP